MTSPIRGPVGDHGRPGNIEAELENERLPFGWRVLIARIVILTSYGEAPLDENAYTEQDCIAAEHFLKRHDPNFNPVTFADEAMVGRFPTSRYRIK